MGQGRLEGGKWREGPSSLEKRNRGRGREGGRVQKLVVMLKNSYDSSARVCKFEMPLKIEKPPDNQQCIIMSNIQNCQRAAFASESQVNVFAVCITMHSEDT